MTDWRPGDCTRPSDSRGSCPHCRGTRSVSSCSQQPPGGPPPPGLGQVSQQPHIPSRHMCDTRTLMDTHMKPQATPTLRTVATHRALLSTSSTETRGLLRPGS